MQRTHAPSENVDGSESEVAEDVSNIAFAGRKVEQEPEILGALSDDGNSLFIPRID